MLSGGADDDVEEGVKLSADVGLCDDWPFEREVTKDMVTWLEAGEDVLKTSFRG